MKRTTVLILALASRLYSAGGPTITNITNAALPSIDTPAGPIQLAPRTIATIFGTNLSSVTASTSPPWKSTLGGLEVHLRFTSVVIGNSTLPCNGDCEATAELIYVSPTQVNFVMPDTNGGFSRVILVKDGTRFDTVIHPDDPGNISVYGGGYADWAIFQVGYECLFSVSSNCGVSWNAGIQRAPLGAITDASGSLISASNPIRQGELLTAWLTGIAPLTLNSGTGLMQAKSPWSLGFGVAQNGKDFPNTLVAAGIAGPYGTFTATGIWTGESPEFVGLDQANVKFPTCTGVPKATAEKRYDVFLFWTGIESGTVVRTYAPFLVAPGDPDCQFQGIK